VETFQEQLQPMSNDIQNKKSSFGLKTAQALVAKKLSKSETNNKSTEGMASKMIFDHEEKQLIYDILLFNYNNFTFSRQKN
jgi:hypothetical protein